ncbi:MAG: hypothetical protein KF902_09125 [Phycisphaeraceae bacterium]|nr:hypothetical protein [Phycisphaeraceae bacterium]MCW5768829.1 hypothetical protein [Phycisphaeraceae bacterium]
MIDPLDGHTQESQERSELRGADGASPADDSLADAEALQNAYIARARSSERPWPPKPGVFVALWPLYLLVAGIAAASPYLMARYADDSIVMPAIRFILCAYTIGLTVMLPMVRLTQHRSADPMLEAGMDAFSLMLPLQPLIWFTVAPPVGIGYARVLAIDLTMGFWTAIIAAWVAITLAYEIKRGESQNHVRRSAAMAGILAVQTLAPLAVGVCASLGLAVHAGFWMLSPVSGVLHLGSDPRSPVGGEEWLGVCSIGLVAVGVWWIALAERRSVLCLGRGQEPTLDAV